MLGPFIHTPNHMDWLDWITAVLAAAVALIALYQMGRRPPLTHRKTDDDGGDVPH